jgi:hypothetical protein
LKEAILLDVRCSSFTLKNIEANELANKWERPLDITNSRCSNIETIQLTSTLELIIRHECGLCHWPYHILSTAFSFQNLVFGIYLNFQRQKSLKKSISPSHILNPNLTE